METINPKGVAKFDPRGMNGTIYVEDHYSPVAISTTWKMVPHEILLWIPVH